MSYYKRCVIATFCLLIAELGFVYGQCVDKRIDLLDTSFPLAIAGQKGWGFRATSAADLNGDGVRENIFLIANVSLYRGKPVWDDGQVWQVYIEAPGAKRTYVFSRFVQLGEVEVLAARGRSEGEITLLILERTPHALNVFEIFYRGAQDFRAVQVLSREIDPSPTPAASGAKAR
jgi:hypothetical protein